jgi:N utilization substance protein B
MAKTQHIFKTPRTRSRGFALQGIYQHLVAGHDIANIETLMQEVGGFEQCDQALFYDILRACIEQKEIFHQHLLPHLDRKLSEISFIEQAVLLIACHELLSHPSVPTAVIINEAVNLAKTFGGEDSFKYVNQVLDKLAKTIRVVEVPQ